MTERKNIGGPPLPTNPLPFRTIGDKRGMGILRELRCPHGFSNPAGCSGCSQERDSGVPPKVADAAWGLIDAVEAGDGVERACGILRWALVAEINP